MPPGHAWNRFNIGRITRSPHCAETVQQVVTWAFAKPLPGTSVSRSTPPCILVGAKRVRRSYAGCMLSIAKIHPGPGVKYLLDQIATGKHDFRPAPNNSDVAYYGGEKAEGEAPGWWA